MGRLAGSDPGYSFRAVQLVDRIVVRTAGTGMILPSSTTIIKETLAIPPSAMAWWGYRVGLDGTIEALREDPEGFLEAADDGEREDVEAYFKGRGVSPNASRDSAGDRGTKAHLVLECLAEQWQGCPDSVEDPTEDLHLWAEALAEDEFRTEGTRYGYAAIKWWDERIQPNIDAGYILDVVSEAVVFSLEDLYAGTFDLGLLWAPATNPWLDPVGGWSVEDAKTHKPADGFTKDGKGPAYDSDAVQIRSYRKAVEEMAARPDIFVGCPFPEGAKTIGQRAVILRDREYRGKSYLEDFREVDYEFFRLLRQVYDHRQRWEKGAA